MVRAKRKKNTADEAERKRLQALQAKQATGEPEWRERYLDGSPRPSMHNARLAITALGIACSYDTFHNKGRSLPKRPTRQARNRRARRGVIAVDVESDWGRELFSIKPLRAMAQDVRAVGFLRPPWALAYQGLS